MMRHTKGFRLFIGLLISALWSFQSCSNGNSGSSGSNVGDSLVGTFNTDTFLIKSDALVQVTGDLEINASKTVEIAGSLEAATDDGQDISITATGDIHISGTVLAGNGGAGGMDGGDLVVVSENGDITVTDSIAFAAGDGGAGNTQDILLAEHQTQDTDTVTISRIEGGAGGKGGSLTLRAPNGTITLPGMDGVIHVGNGGAGEAISVQGEDLLITEVESRLSNAGGDSGWLHLEASRFQGPEFTVYILEADVIGPDGSTVAVEAGTRYYEFLDVNPFSGGNGGSAGDCYYGVDENEETTWPDSTAIASFQLNLATHKKRYGEPLGRLSESVSAVVVKGSDGGNGFFNGGNGASVHYNAKPGATPGGHGTSVRVEAGSGGLGFFSSGTGGKAWAKGGDGADGADPSGDGGNGGDAEAVGGDSLLKTRNGPFEDIKGGWALAKSGIGGDGGGQCYDNVASYGGDGGDAGTAHAIGGNFNLIYTNKITAHIGAARAYGANGGDGGGGNTEGGTGGKLGSAKAEGGNDVGQWSGYAGRSGTSCPPVRITPDEVELSPEEKAYLEAQERKESLWVDVTPKVSWRSSDSDIAAVDQSGTVTAYGEGSATIFAEYNGNTATCRVQVVPQATFPPGTGTFTQNWSNGKKTTGSILLKCDGTFTQMGTGGDAGDFTAIGTWSHDETTGLITIHYTSYILNGVEIAPAQGDTWHSLSGNLTDGKGVLTSQDGSWTVGIAAPN